ncbi:MAG: phosphoribosylformylglycinamidine synthase [Treponema sp.]|nr:phosphoribosylformylglycinamidine synthase [Treponema sp.]
MNTYRVYVEKKNGYDLEAQRLKSDLIDFFGNQFDSIAKIQQLRILFRYDVTGLSAEQFEKAVKTVFSEPQCDHVYVCDNVPQGDNSAVFGIEYLPGQYDQKADSAEQCTELAVGIKPVVHCAKFFVLSSGEAINNEALKAIQSYLVNPVDSRLVVDTYQQLTASQMPADIPVLAGFVRWDKAELDALAKNYGLAMSIADLEYCRNYFDKEGRDPTLAELRILDTYWSDHCRHTTFTTILESITLNGKDTEPLQKALALYEEARAELYGDAAGRSRTLMDMATIGGRLLKKRGLVSDLDESPEINACTIKVKAKFICDQHITEEPYLLLFKNETHNHPTEIEPFGGAATCLGGAIRDPLSGRAYVYQAMRITGAADPRCHLTETLPGKLPQIKIAREAAAGYSSYGNQIGIAVGQVAEFYHSGFAAKRMELGAVIGAVPEAQVRRVPPAKGDMILLVGGKTGRDGIGGATGSSKIHSGESVETAGAEVQKGNAVEERKLQRLFRDGEVTKLIKRCNDFGAGGVSVAVGELASGLDINLDAVPKKYSGLDGTELAISESQERMAVVVSPENAGKFIAKAAAENLDAVVIATVTAGETEGNDEQAKLTMRWQDKTIANLKRGFLDSHGAPRRADVIINTISGQTSQINLTGTAHSEDPQEQLAKIKTELGSLRSCSRRGLQERFDGSIGAASVLFPWGGKYQATPECGMAALLPAAASVFPGDSKNAETGTSLPQKSLAANINDSITASLMSFGFDPALMETDPFNGAKAAVKEALAKFACLGGDYRKARLSMQEYFERMDKSESWGKVTAALLGALEAQLALEVPAIGGKDSMSGSYRDPANGIDLTVPPTLVVFAAGTTDAASVRSGTLSGKTGNPIILLYDDGENDQWETFKANMQGLVKLSENGLVKAAYPAGAGGVGAALALMAFGNMTGVEADSLALSLLNEKTYPGTILVELDGEAINKAGGEALLGEALQNPVWKGVARTIVEPVFRINSSPHKQNASSAAVPLAELRDAFEAPLCNVYPQTIRRETTAKVVSPYGKKTRKKICRLQSSSRTSHPLVILPVFPGTNCEWDMERSFKAAGARTQLVIFRNRNADDIAASIKDLALAINNAQIVALSGGFSAGDEPDGSGKFIANVLRSPAIADAVQKLLKKQDGLMLGICNGFQALIKLGLVPWGAYREAAEDSPTLTFNRIGRHVSRMVRTVTMPSSSPWLALEEPGSVHILPVSHGEGRIVISHNHAEAFFKSGQVPFCYSDSNGNPALVEPDNPNGSDYAIEALTSPDGRILGKMAHSERCGQFVHINIPGNKFMKIFEAGVKYFT